MGRQGAARAALAAAILAATMAAGCVEELDTYYGFDADQQYKNPGVFEGNYSVANGYSFVLRPGIHNATLPEVKILESTLPAWPTPGGAETTEGEVLIPLAIWRPYNVTEPVPVIVDAGPYFEYGEHCKKRNQNPCQEFVDDTIDYPSQATPFLLANMLPHGYAVVQLAVRGTGTHGGCMDLLGPSEAHDLDQAITWLGEQPWSNGNVAMIGASYDGSTQWEVAALGNPHLKAIIPVSGLPDIYDLMFHNGTAETRGLIMHNQVYWPFGFDDDFPQELEDPTLPVEPPIPPPVTPPGIPRIGIANGRSAYQDRQNLLCPEVVEGSAVAAGSVVTGNRMGAYGTDANGAYWVERDHRPAVLENYEGAVFLVHGLQDWNVDPHAAIPFNVALREKGLLVKEWYGQWGHAYPDSTCASTAPEWVSLPCRLDFAEVLKRFLDHTLKGVEGEDLGPMVQVQDNTGAWRNLDAFPPAAQWTELQLSADGQLVDAGAVAATVTLDPPTSGAVEVIEFKGPVLEEDLRFSGLPQVRVPFVMKGQGGQLAVWLLDENPDGRVRAPMAGMDDRNRWVPYGIPTIGHGQMNLLYHAGGEEAAASPPSGPTMAMMEMEPLDVLVPKGHRLVLWVSQMPYPDHQASTTAAPVDVLLGEDAVLRLPVVEADPLDMFPVPGVNYPQRAHTERMYVSKPVVSQVAPGADLAACVASQGASCGGLL